MSTVLSEVASASSFSMSASIAAERPMSPKNSVGALCGVVASPSTGNTRTRVLPEEDRLAARQDRLDDAHAADEGAVLRAEVAHAQIFAQRKLAMDARDAIVGDDDVGEAARAEAHARLEVDALAGVDAVDDLEDAAAAHVGLGPRDRDRMRLVVDRILHRAHLIVPPSGTSRA